MNTYHKYLPNVFLAKCENLYNKWDIIEVKTKYGKENKHFIHNLIAEKNWFYYYSITRTDGLDSRDFADKKADKITSYSKNAENKSIAYHKASSEWSDFLLLAEPIKVWHHSEERHRKLIKRNDKRMEKSIEYSKKAESYESRIDYWRNKADKINLSMPESIEYYSFLVEQKKAKHEWLKSWTIEKSHSYSLTYAKKELNEAIKNLDFSKKLWS